MVSTTNRFYEHRSTVVGAVPAADVKAIDFRESNNHMKNAVIPAGAAGHYGGVTPLAVMNILLRISRSPVASRSSNAPLMDSV